MAGAGLIAIKRRIKSVTSTKKITKAMGLVATAKLRKSREKLDVNEKYYNSFKELMSEVLSDAVDDLEGNNIYLYGNKSKNKLYVVLTSDSGLCGGFNANVVSTACDYMRKDREHSISIVVGQKGRAYFKKFKFDTAAEYVQIPDLPTLKEATQIADHAVKMYENGEVGEVYVVYTKFYSTVKQEVKVERILPLDIEKRNADKDSSNVEYIEYEPEIHTLLHNIVKTHIRQRTLNFMLNSKASEQGSRMSAMDGATKNANDLLEQLNLKFNRVRQSAITQEISEIVGGAEAQR